MILFIDTTENIAKIALGKKSRLIDAYSWNAKMKQSEELLIEIDKLLSKNNVNLADLKGIIVVCGPGGYTGLRVGISCANALAFGLGIPIKGIKCDRDDKGIKSIKKIIKEGGKSLKEVKLGEFVIPVYFKPPKITKPKKNNN